MEMEPIALPELRKVMDRNGDAVSYPYWATQKRLWNGREVLVEQPSRQWVNQEDDE